MILDFASSAIAISKLRSSPQIGYDFILSKNLFALDELPLFSVSTAKW